MLHLTDLATRPSDDDSAALPPATPPRLRDRAQERWSLTIGAIFAGAEALCLCAAGFLTVLFATLVGEQGELSMVGPLLALGASFVLAMLVLSYTQARALSGQRALRRRASLAGRAFAAGFLCLALALLHPLLGAAPLAATLLGAGALALVARRAPHEPLWDFLPQEAVALLSGRDARGLELALAPPPGPVLATATIRAAQALALVLAAGAAAYLTGQSTLALAGYAPPVLAAPWATGALLAWLAEVLSDRAARLPATTALRPDPPPEGEAEEVGLHVTHLTLRDASGTPRLSDVNLECEPGMVTGLLGDSGSGKSLLLQALADPHALEGMQVTGRASLSGRDLWQRAAAEQAVMLAHLPEAPILLAASGADNLTCFHPGDLLARGKWFLEQLVFATDMVEEICATGDARRLPYMQRKALALARAFLLGPELYLLDRPEDGLPPKLIPALERRITHEVRLGRSILMVTDNRALLALCDRMVVLQNGRVVDYGTAEGIRDRQDTGWARFRGRRELASDDSLRFWVRSHFYRAGDEANRRKLAAVASQLLALSCQSRDRQAPGHVSFTFKHFQGHCLLRMQDSEAPIGQAHLDRAREEAASDKPEARLSPLAALMRLCLAVEPGSHLDDRMIETRIETYDPRKTRPPPLPGDTDAPA
ncbi:ABC transporter ATP-binding protein [Roseivivax sp. GX 12232]|uniref:ABC transporter ATP-binding protein n=1 Tax=Roseivivax sp. GX 12232 TaxID=2900547 RepID=UPI001E46D647|nr:ABC transporter ATP-binding protein [Roseivivax sp. GX 12232]MCE0503910.1 ABC transporter ATP-binding protein [Roseivivax sp. GX 12232]